MKNIASCSECERKLQEAEDVFKMKLQDKIDGMQKLLERESQRCQVLFNLDLFENFHCFQDLLNGAEHTDTATEDRIQGPGRKKATFLSSFQKIDR